MARPKQDLGESDLKTNINPFEEGATYDALLEDLGESDLKTYLEPFNLTDEEVEWIKVELETYKTNNLKPE